MEESKAMLDAFYSGVRLSALNLVHQLEYSVTAITIFVPQILLSACFKDRRTELSP
jgi:hypothetical protein